MALLMTLSLKSARSALVLAARISALIWLLLGVNLIGLPAAHAEDTQYISDMLLVPLRSGAGSEFRIVNRGLPSGIALLVFGPVSYTHLTLPTICSV